MLRSKKLFSTISIIHFRNYLKTLTKMSESELNSVPRAMPITSLNYDTDFDSFTDSSAADTILTPVSKKPKLEKKVSSFKSILENEMNSYSYNEVSLKLKLLFETLGAKHQDKKHIFEKLSQVLDVHENLNDPIPVTQSQYFAHLQASSITEEHLLKQTSSLKESEPNIFKSPVSVKTNRKELEHIFSSSPVISKPLQASSSPVITNYPGAHTSSQNAELLHNTPSSPLKEHKPKIPDQRRQYGTLQLTTQFPVQNSQTPKPEIVEKHVKAITLSKEQEIVIQLAEMGENIFYTGSAGTGKSLLLRELIKKLREKHPSGTVGVTASTGLAAYNIGGMTINSFTGIGLGTGTATYLAEKIRRMKVKKKLWTDLKVLIIDEVSMIDGELLDKLDEVAKKIRGNKRPFGGVQIILCGDFYQLPPVSKTGKMKFAFESNFWKNHIKTQVLLQKVFRQQGDKQFLQMLQEVRNGNVTPSTVKKFKALERPLSSLGGLIPTKLFPTRNEVDKSNHKMISNLDGDGVTYAATDTGTLANTPQGMKMLESFLAPKSITLKVGAQVMMIKNMDETLVNGSLGTVVGFLYPATYETVHGFDKTLKDKFKEHSILDRLREPANNLEDSIFDFLAQSKMIVKEAMKNNDSIEALPNISEPSLIEYESQDPEDVDDVLAGVITTNEELLKSIESKEQIIQSLRDNQGISGKVLPMVCFRLSNGATRTVAVEEEEFSVEDEKQVTVVKRTQIPLMLAWALSIHKSQGQTLKYACVDLRKIFENGQAYVALSRAEHRRGLQVLNFDPKKITTNPKVIEFYKNLTNAETSINHVEGENKPYKSEVPTQIRNLHELTATPERFQKKPKIESRGAKRSNSGDIMSLLSQSRKKTSVSDKENDPDSINNGKKNDTKIALASDMMQSDDDSTSFQDLFGNK